MFSFMRGLAKAWHSVKIKISIDKRKEERAVLESAWNALFCPSGGNLLREQSRGGGLSAPVGCQDYRARNM